ncbi:uncharacterized protein SCHCODRAFT_02624261, partial [Schizophyllum commune H4-8]|uniref:uncharacterized protein n=1 Tax=Schizophyllum commune (strain H4-8 / FGSC 9210) TaxID=578458 RepID=UPI00215F5A20
YTRRAWRTPSSDNRSYIQRERLHSPFSVCYTVVTTVAELANGDAECSVCMGLGVRTRGQPTRRRVIVARRRMRRGEAACQSFMRLGMRRECVEKSAGGEDQVRGSVKH